MSNIFYFNQYLVAALSLMWQEVFANISWGRRSIHQVCLSSRIHTTRFGRITVNVISLLVSWWTCRAPLALNRLIRQVGEPVHCAYQLAKLSPLLLCHPSCQGDRCHSPGLSDGDDALSSDAGLIQVLGDLSGLPRAGLPWCVRESGSG